MQTAAFRDLRLSLSLNTPADGHHMSNNAKRCKTKFKPEHIARTTITAKTLKMPSSKQNRSFKYKKNVKSTYTSSQYTNQPARPNVSSVNVGDREVSVITSIQRNSLSQG